MWLHNDIVIIAIHRPMVVYAMQHLRLSFCLVMLMMNDNAQMCLSWGIGTTQLPSFNFSFATPQPSGRHCNAIQDYRFAL